VTRRLGLAGINTRNERGRQLSRSRREKSCELKKLCSFGRQIVSHLTKQTFPLKGRMAATTIPESAENRQYPMSYGACNLNWEEADDAERLQLAQRLVSQLINEDNIPEAEIRKEFSQVEEFTICRTPGSMPHPRARSPAAPFKLATLEGNC
jgi:hypothetical protein